MTTHESPENVITSQIDPKIEFKFNKEFPKNTLSASRNMEDRTHIVIGAGIIGSWTAWHLQKNGCKTVLIDNFPLPHTRGK